MSNAIESVNWWLFDFILTPQAKDVFGTLAGC